MGESRSINELSARIHVKGYTVKEFLKMIKRKEDWYYIHSNGGKDYDFLVLAINGLEDKS